MSTSAVDNLRDNVTKTKTRFNTLQEEITSRMNECSECMKTVEKLHLEAKELTINLEEQLDNANNEEKEWNNIKARLATSSTKGMVILNVGGVKYATSVDTLMREKDTFFTALLSKQWQLEQSDVDRSIFIDRNGKLFYHILEYLRTEIVSNDVMNNEALCFSLMIEAKYFRLHNLITKLNIYFPDGTLLQSEQKMKLNEFYGKQNQRWELIYKASRDGFGASVFHSRCDNKGPTMTIIQSNNTFLFGGYTAVAWTSDGSPKNDPRAFLFTLTNPHVILPTKYLINSANAGNAVLHNGSYGPSFGSGPDLQLANNSNSTNSSIGFPVTYTDAIGKGNATFTGATAFITSEIEVFKLA